MQKTILKIFFDFEIIAFELVSLNTRIYWERRLVIGCQYVKKESQDFRYYKNRIFWANFLSESLLKFALNTHFCWERILVIGCQYVNKLYQDFRY